jgi:hypothetical protein
MTTRVTLPRDAVIDRLMLRINGTTNPDPSRHGYMDRERADRTLELFKLANENGMSPEDMDESLKKSVSVATGLTYYDLRAPALNLFPTVTPLRNAIPRMQRTYPGPAANWKVVQSTVGSGLPYMGWVPEGRRSASMSYTTADKSQTYKTIGEEDSLTEEARFAAQGFEDEDALVQLRLLLKMFVKEEAALLGGDNSLALGTPGTVSLTASTTTVATLPTNTYSVGVVMLTQEGFLNATTTSVATSLAITGNDGKSYTLNGGSGNASAVTTLAVTAGQALAASVPTKAGAVAYAWYAGTSGNEKFQSITTVNSVVFTNTLSTTGQAFSAVTTDSSTNGTAFDGLLTTAWITANGAYNAWQATGSGTIFATETSPTNGALGVGTGLTASGSGGIKEIDDMLVSMWNTNRISATVIYVNAQELRNITAKVLTNASGPLLRYNVEADQAGMVEYKLTASGVVSFYFNPYTPDGGVRIPIKVHPNLAPGTLIAWAEVLPPWYVSNATPEVAVVQTRQDYYAEVWPKTLKAANDNLSLAA